MKNYKLITLFGLPYLTACSILYHFAYWDTFKINGLTFISLNELIKSFVHPFIYFFVIVALNFVITEGVFQINKVFPHGEGRNTFLGKKLNSKWGILISLIIWISIVIFLYFNGNVNRWFTWALLLGIVPMLFLDRYGLWLNEFENSNLRIHAIRIFVFLPILSFASGKYQSELIFRNIHYQYAAADTILHSTNNASKDILKFIGSTEQYIIFTNLNNSIFTFVRNDKLEVMQLKQK